ncbi:hypothetical protein PFICI_09251 [Pestalotiopsis fici W106-1]|uniref:N-acetyltransferase domain-containing protein n=1 Tax=Pestalotiopsis fici (strain W106-1 / CGMCC3.15140) TaxID=1229662 RepID=W3WZT9_PESFW|nr:uncharacterized protein PFICI_09251 [Pestalotiopsis fici W106-1]ETS79398.1 hypothetical protein PFICI_09251 [Pestalotiopsis fici W106-1]
MSDEPASHIVVRVATMEDLDDLTKIAQAGFPDDPEFDYRFPHRQKYPDDHWRWTRREYEGYLNQPDKYAVLLATLPTNQKSDEYNDEHKQERELNRSWPVSVALAVWDMAVTTESQVSGLFPLHASGKVINCGRPLISLYPVDIGIDQRRDANPEHMLEFANTLSSAFETHFAKYAGNQIHLWLLTTHPDFRRRGAGSALCRWGLQLAQKRGQPVTVLASWMGKTLYEQLGFQTLGIVVVQVPSEEEKLEVSCLERKPEHEMTSGRGSCIIL